MTPLRRAPFATVAALVASAGLVLSGCGGPQESSGASDSDGGESSSTSCPPADGSAERRTSFDEAPPQCIDPAKTYTATMATDAGDITVALDAKKAPKAVNNFVVLSRYHFYDGLTFHRVIQDFMIQGGDPDGTGAGGPGYTFEDELPQAGDYEVGSLAMANAGPNTNGSQFFIVTGEAGVALPPSYSLFGTVTGGMKAVRAIEADGSAQSQGTPTTTHTITSVTISES